MSARAPTSSGPRLGRPCVAKPSFSLPRRAQTTRTGSGSPRFWLPHQGKRLRSTHRLPPRPSTARRLCGRAALTCFRRNAGGRAGDGLDRSHYAAPLKRPADLSVDRRHATERAMEGTGCVGGLTGRRRGRHLEAAGQRLVRYDMARAPVAPARRPRRGDEATRSRRAGRSHTGGPSSGRRVGRLETCLIITGVLALASFLLVEAFSSSAPPTRQPNPIGVVRAESASQAGRTVRLDGDKTTGVLLVSRWAQLAFCSPAGDSTGDPLAVPGLRSLYAPDVAAGRLDFGVASVKSALGHGGFADLAAISTGHAQVTLCEARVQVEGLFQRGSGL